jgi:hypothetical protein
MLAKEMLLPKPVLKLEGEVASLGNKRERDALARVLIVLLSGKGVGFLSGQNRESLRLR